ncbi:MAG: SsrA-binding protein SmpB [Chitinivibrionales bacterium]|nr:SsrA-binding protein SmpB [Chitinivibrionales bacterium]
MKIIAKNRKAYHDYEILEKCEAGIELIGSEVKSIRAGKINLSDSYATCSSGEILINHLHISPYEQINTFSPPDPYRKRRLLLHKKQIFHLCSEVERKHLTLVPLSVYFAKQWVKLEIGLCRGRKKYDKRDKIAEKESKKKIASLLNRRRR